MKKFLFETHHLYYWPNFRPIIDELKKDSNNLIEVSQPIRNSKEELYALKKNCKNLEIEFIEYQNEDMRTQNLKRRNYDVIIVGNVGQLNALVHKDTIAVMVYHGIGLKQSYYNDIDARIDIRSVESENRFEELKNLGHKNIYLTGFTKLDRLKTITKSEINLIKKEIDLDFNRKTILFAPTFYPTSLELIFEEVRVLSQEYNVIVKLHAFSWRQNRYKYQSEIYEKLSNENQSIILLSDDVYDIIPYYKIADILISDISSTLFEFLPLDRPIVQINYFNLRLKHKIFNKRFWRKLDIKRLENIDFTYKVNQSGDLLSRVFFALENPEELSDLRKKALIYYLYKFDGKASQRLVKVIKEFSN